MVDEHGDQSQDRGGRGHQDWSQPLLAREREGLGARHACSAELGDLVHEHLQAFHLHPCPRESIQQCTVAELLFQELAQQDPDLQFAVYDVEA